MANLFTDVALYHKHAIVLIGLRLAAMNVALYMVEHLESTFAHFQSHLQEVISFQDKNLSEVPCLDSRLPLNFGKEADFSEILVLLQICDVGLRLFVNHSDLASDDKEYFGTHFTLNNTVIVDRINSFLEDEGYI